MRISENYIKQIELSMYSQKEMSRLCLAPKKKLAKQWVFDSVLWPLATEEELSVKAILLPAWTRRTSMRLIDRSELLDKFNLECKTAQERYMALINAPTISAVPVVRCRDCKWFNHYTMECESDDVATDHEGGASFSLNFGPDDFCSYGQRKEADHEA